MTNTCTFFNRFRLKTVLTTDLKLQVCEYLEEPDVNAVFAADQHLAVVGQSKSFLRQCIVIPKDKKYFNKYYGRITDIVVQPATCEPKMFQKTLDVVHCNENWKRQVRKVTFNCSWQAGSVPVVFLSPTHQPLHFDGVTSLKFINFNHFERVVNFQNAQIVEMRDCSNCWLALYEFRQLKHLKKLSFVNCAFDYDVFLNYEVIQYPSLRTIIMDPWDDDIAYAFCSSALHKVSVHVKRFPYAEPDKLGRIVLFDHYVSKVLFNSLVLSFLSSVLLLF